jgi:N-acylglucosamine 2-epimerase
MYFTVTRDGQPLRKRRYWFSETFYIIANAEYYMATKDKNYLERAVKYFNFVYKMYKDPSADPFKITPKSYAQTRNMKALANPMIMLNVTSIMRQADEQNYAYYNDIITKLIEDIKVFYKPEYKAMFENLTLDNEVVLNSSPCRVINPGHDIECAWFLLEEGVKRNDQSVIDFAKTVFDNAFELGWDKEYGGITYFKDVLGLPVEAYEHDMKLWWPHNETVIASLMLYKYTGENKYKEIFDKVCDYAFTHFPIGNMASGLGTCVVTESPPNRLARGILTKGLSTLCACLQSAWLF